MTLAQRWENKGFQQGFREGKLEVILNMLKMKLDLRFIQQVTGLSLAEIKNLQQKNYIEVANNVRE